MNEYQCIRCHQHSKIVTSFYSTTYRCHQHPYPYSLGQKAQITACFLSSSAEFSSWLSCKLSVFVSGGIFFGIRINPRLWQKTRPLVKSQRQLIGQFWIISDFSWQNSKSDMEEYILKEISVKRWSFMSWPIRLFANQGILKPFK